MPLQQHLCRACPPCGLFRFLHGKRASSCWDRNGLARTDSVLAYGHVARIAEPVMARDEDGHQHSMGQTDIETDKMKT